jgi:hypothetical protein
MKHGNGIEDREDRSNGMEILIPEVFAKSKPTEPLRLTNKLNKATKWCVERVPVHCLVTLVEGKSAR